VTLSSRKGGTDGLEGVTIYGLRWNGGPSGYFFRYRREASIGLNTGKSLLKVGDEVRLTASADLEGEKPVSC
jgi:hypothetical protein